MYWQLEALRHCLPPSVRPVLDDLPETLDGTYERVLRDINKANREHAHRLLQCLTVAVRPLRVEELAEVLAVDFDAARREGIPRLNPNWRWTNQHQAVLSTCSSLITIVDDGDSQVVQFSHFSVKEFLTSDRLAHSSGDVSPYHILLEPAHTILAQACMGVLLRLDDNVDKFNARDIPLAEYASQHWADHARFKNVLPCIQVAMELLFDVDKPHYAAWRRVYDIDIDCQWPYFTNSRMPDPFPLYYAAQLGFYDLAAHLIAKHPGQVNATGGWNRTPLVATLYGNHLHIAELLHRNGADVNVRGCDQMTPLQAASWDRLVDVVRWLLCHGADASAQDTENWTPLHEAAYCGDLQIFRMLLEHNADINVRTDLGEYPLHLAATSRDYRDHLTIMQLLLDHGADPNARDYDGSTPLHHSSWWEKENIYPSCQGTVEGTRLLLKHGANVDAMDRGGRTPLQIALAHGRQEMAAVLLEHRPMER